MADRMDPKGNFDPVDDQSQPAPAGEEGAVAMRESRKNGTFGSNSEGDASA